MRGIQSWGSIHKKGHVMSKRENEASKFRPSDRPLNEYEQEQKALRKNLERLKAERLAREVAKSKSELCSGGPGGLGNSPIPDRPLSVSLPLKSHFRSHII